MRTRAFFYDGRSTDRVPVVVSLSSGRLEVRGEGVDLSAPVSSVAVAEGVGGTRGALRFPGGEMCAVEDALFLEQAAAAQGRRRGRLLRRWERSAALVAVSLLAVAVLLAAGVRYGVPALAKRAAFLLPGSVETRLGEESLEMLDRLAFSPTELPAARIEAIREIFRDVAREAAIGGKPRVVFRKGGALGANALALPAGIVVVTDEMALLSENDGEIAAVLAHEAGHVRNRHGLRHLLQNSLAALLVSSATGDLASISSLAAAAPTLLIHAKYSRDFEREADSAAVRYLASRYIPLQRYADILARLQSERERKGREKGAGYTDYLSTHPPTGERIEAIGGATPRKPGP